MARANPAMVYGFCSVMTSRSRQIVSPFSLMPQSTTRRWVCGSHISKYALIARLSSSTDLYLSGRPTGLLSGSAPLTGLSFAIYKPQGYSSDWTNPGQRLAMACPPAAGPGWAGGPARSAGSAPSSSVAGWRPGRGIAPGRGRRRAQAPGRTAAPAVRPAAVEAEDELVEVAAQ